MIVLHCIYNDNDDDDIDNNGSNKDHIYIYCINDDHGDILDGSTIVFK